MYLSLLLATLNVTGPIFVIVLLGLVLKRVNLIDDHFVSVSSRLVFSLCLPILLFTTITSIDMAAVFSAGVFWFSIVACLGTFLVSWVLSSAIIRPVTDRGVVVQAAFRSNLGVIGLALCANAYGAEGLALASLLMASLTVAYNVLSVFILSLYLGDRDFSLKRTLVDIARNPLIVAIVIAFGFQFAGLSLPTILLSAGQYIGSLALPLALLGTGAGLSLKALRQSSVATGLVVALRCTVLPAGVTAAAVAMGLRGVELGVTFLLFVAPTATASYAMVRAMDGNDVLAANLVTATTIVSILTCSIGFYVLRVLELV